MSRSLRLPRAALLVAFLLLTACAESHTLTEASGRTDGGSNACDIVGEYAAPAIAVGFRTFFGFRADGTWITAIDPSALEGPSIWGEYDFDGSTLVLRGEPCGPDVEGRYAIDFDASCSTFTFDAIDEACAGRPFDGVTLTRQ